MSEAPLESASPARLPPHGALVKPRSSEYGTCKTDKALVFRGKP